MQDDSTKKPIIIAHYQQSRDDTQCSAPRDFDRGEVLQYVEEMCATLAFMSRSHDCSNLSNLLLNAAAEASRSKLTAMTERSCNIVPVHANRRETK